MSEFDSIAQELQRQAEAEEKRQREDDNALLGRVLEIYGQKYVAEQLRKLGQNEWSRERLNRRVNGKGTPRPLPPEEALLQNASSPPAHHPHYQFRFIDLFAGIGGIRNGFEAIGGQCVFTSEWNKNAVRTYKANWYNDEQPSF
jgi:DNA (cytosine-5)-methyltransferase 1